MNQVRTGASVYFNGVYKNFGGVSALFPTTLEIPAGEFLTLLGPSGSGKTTLLNIAAGYLSPDGGQILVGDRDVTYVQPRNRNIGMMFQNYALFPHMSVFENVAYGLKVRRYSPTDIRRRVLVALEMVKLEGLEQRAIQQLSGGQQQRVALARAMVIEPDLLLMDEPLGALDRQLRRHVQLEVRRLHEQSRRTTIYVTHDQEEALVMSDRIAILNGGRLEQIGTPAELYKRPKNAFVATFLGESNLLPVRVATRTSNELSVRFQNTSKDYRIAAEQAMTLGDEARLLIRPEHVRLASNSEWGLDAEVLESVYLGELTAIRLRLETEDLIWMRSMTLPTVRVGERIRIGWDSCDCRLLEANQ